MGHSRTASPHPHGSPDKPTPHALPEFLGHSTIVTEWLKATRTGAACCAATENQTEFLGVLLNPYKTEYKIPALTVGVKENF